MPKKKRPRKPVARDFAVKLFAAKPKLRAVKDGDTWKSLGGEHGMDPMTLKNFNFNTGDPQSLNWYLHEYVGCRKVSKDGQSYVFSADDKRFGSGYIVIPMVRFNSAKASEFESKQRKKEAKVHYEDRCDVRGVQCPTEEGAELLIKRFERGVFKQGNAYMAHPKGIRRGLYFRKQEGDRVVLGVASTFVVFLMNDRVYTQDAWDFVDDVTYDAFGDAGRNAAGVVVFVKVQMALIAGFVSAGSLVGFVAVAGTNVAKFVHENDIKGLIVKFAAIYAAKKALETAAPALHDAIFSRSTLFRVLGEVVKRLPSSLTKLSAEDVAQLIGGIVAKLGTKAAETILKQMLEVAMSLVSFVGTKLVPKTGEVAIDETKRMAAELLKTLKALGIDVDENASQSIVGELVGNDAEVRRILEELSRALKR